MLRRPRHMRFVRDWTFQGLRMAIIEATIELTQAIKRGVIRENDIVMDSEIWRRLPRELLLQVLASLPTVTGERLRRVCKEWKELLSPQNASFQSISTTLPARAFPAFLYVCSADRDHLGMCFLIHPQSTKPIRQFHLPNFEYEDVIMLAVCKNLICFAISRSPLSLLIYNPVIRTQKILPPLEGIDICNFVGFHFDTSTKVCTMVLGDHQGDNNIVTGIYSSTTGEWVILELTNSALSIFPTGEGVYSRGKFYWANDWSRPQIVVFNVEQTCWEVIELPRINADAWPRRFELTGSERNVILVHNNELRLWKLIEEELNFRWLELPPIPRSLRKDARRLPYFTPVIRNRCFFPDSQRLRPDLNAHYPHIVVNSFGWLSIYLPGIKWTVFDAGQSMIFNVDGGPLRVFEESFFIPFRAYELNNVWWPL